MGASFGDESGAGGGELEDGDGTDVGALVGADDGADERADNGADNGGGVDDAGGADELDIKCLVS